MKLIFGYCYLFVQLLVLENFAEEIEFLFAGDYRGAYKDYIATGGGVARVKSLIKNNSIFIYVGNILPEYPNRQKAEVAQKILQSLNASAIVLGKQELYLSPENLDWFIRTTRNLISSANLEHKGIELHQHKIIGIGDIMFAILGYTTESIEAITTNTSFHVKNAIQSLNEKVREINLAYRKVRLIIAAGCAGVESAKIIALRTSSINIVFSSCSRTLLWHNDDPPPNIYKYGEFPLKLKNRDGNEVLVLHSFGTTRFLGKLNVTLNEKGAMVDYIGEMIDIPSSVPVDPEMLELIKNEPDSPNILTGVVGKSRVYLDGTCSKAECNFGNLLADSFVEYVCNRHTGEFWTDTPIAIVQSNIIRSNINASILKGQLMAEDLNSALEDMYDILSLEATGADLYECMEYALDIKSKHGADKFLQVSGLRVVYDNRRPPGNRIVDLKARCADCVIPAYERVDKKKKYNLTVMMSFSLDEYHFSESAKTSLFRMHNVSNYQALIEYIQRRKYIAPCINDRIVQQPVFSSTCSWLAREALLLLLLYLVPVCN